MKKRQVLAWVAVFAMIISLVPAFPVFADDPAFTVTYNANATNAVGTVPVDSKLYSAGDTAVLLDGKGLSRPGYHFRGWRVGTANGTYRVPGASIEITGNTTVYAWWSAVVTSRTQVDWSAPRLDRAAFMTEIGETTQIGIINGTSATWSSNNESIATVDQTGLVVAKGNGDATITARIADKDLTCIVTVGYKSQNPVLPPSWQLYIPDGEPHVFNGVMYVYGSHDVQGGSCWSDYKVVYSKDAVHWTDAGYSFTSADLPEPFNTATNSLWAPDCVYHPQTGKYYLFSCGTDTDAEYFVAESTSPVGPFQNARQITYKGGDKNGQRIGNIDPGVFVDDDGTFWLAIAGVDGQQRTYTQTYGSSRFRYGKFDIETATVDSTSIIDVHDIMTANGVTVPFEGPSLRKFGDYYYYIYVSDYKNPKPSTTLRQDVEPAMLDYLYTKDIKDGSSWKYGGTFVNTAYFPAAVNTHGSVTKLGDQYYVTYHTPMGASGGARHMRIERIDIDPTSGLITPVKMSSTGVRSAFDLRERIQFSSAVDFSNGRWGTTPFAQKTIPSGGYAENQYLFMSTRGQYIGFRYVDFKSAVANAVTLNVQTTAEGGRLEIVGGEPGTAEAVTMASVTLPNTSGTWQEVSVPIEAVNSVKGIQPVYVALANAPSAGRVNLDWFMIDGSDAPLSVKDSSGAELVNGGTSVVSGDQDVFVAIEPDTDYYYAFGGVDVYYQGEAGNPTGSYFDGPTVPGAYVTSVLNDAEAKPVPSDGKITVPVVKGQSTDLYVTSYKNGAAKETLKHSFTRGYLRAAIVDDKEISATGALEPGQKGKLIFAVYGENGALAYFGAADEFTGTSVETFGIQNYPPGKYTYKVFCWDEFVPMYEAVSLS